jgi:hypothetical protein
MRLIANAVLMISDLDVLFTLLALVTYLQQGSFVIPVVLLVFGGVYCLGCYKATRRQQLYEYVNDKKYRSSDDIVVFEYEDGKQLPKFRSNAAIAGFLELPANQWYTNTRDPQEKQEKVDQMKRGQQAVRQWQGEYANLDDSQQGNTMKLQHSIPFYRLACFGWQGDLGPMDLAGVLNANALYSFTIGTPALILSVWTLFSSNGRPVQERIIFGISALIGFISFVLSLVNILQDYTKKLKDLLRKEQILETRQTEAQQKTDELMNVLSKKLDDSFNTEREKMLSPTAGPDDCMEKSIKLAKLKELYENRKKEIFQTLDGVHRTEQITDLLPEVKSPIKKKSKKDHVKVTCTTIVTFFVGQLLLLSNVGIHAFLVIHAITQSSNVKDTRYFYGGLGILAVVGCFKVLPGGLFAFGFFEEKPTFVTLMDNLSVLLPLATSIVYMGTGGYSIPSDIELAGICVSIAEVIVSTVLSSANPKSINFLSKCFQGKGLEFEQDAQGEEMCVENV